MGPSLLAVCTGCLMLVWMCKRQYIVTNRLMETRTNEVCQSLIVNSIIGLHLQTLNGYF